MINVETIKFINLLNDLATLGAEGIKSFSDATRETIYDLLYYYNESPDEDGHFPIVRDSCVVDDPDYYHHDIISYYDSDSEEYTIRVVFDDDGIPFIQVKLILSDEEIIIEHGRWYFT